MRRANLSAIVRELHERGPLSRSELVARTGLTRSAIRGLVGELVPRAWPRRSRPSGSGRRAGRRRWSPRARGRGRGRVSLEVDFLAAAVVGLGGEVLGLDARRSAAGALAVDDIVADLAGAGRAAATAAADPTG